MSSTVFAVELRTDRRCRDFVFWSGVVLTGIGAAWLATQGFEMAWFARRTRAAR